MNTSRFVLGCAVSAIVASGVTFGVLSFHNKDNCEGEVYTHLNASLRCDTEYALDKSALVLLQGLLGEYIDEQKGLGNVSVVSLYVRDLNNGPTLGINEQERFAPASLLKLPLLLTYLSLKEEYGPSLFSRTLSYTPPSEEPDQLIMPEQMIEANTPYTIEELLRRMMIYSDNRAYLSLLDYLHQLFPDRDRLLETYIDLGVIDPEDLQDQTISTKLYSSIFTQLFHASYLRERSSSEWALHLMAESTFEDGLRAGVPDLVEVADKFGERYGFDDGLKQLHDCGIVYFPENPYLLCVMTRGQDIEKLKTVIAGISSLVYQEFEARKY